MADKESRGQIHPTAIIDPSAEVAVDVSIGPYSVIGEQVEIGSGTRIHAHVHIAPHTTIGSGCEIYPYASIGTPPQDLKFNGRVSQTLIGNNNIIREFVTINRGSVGPEEVTRIGENNLLMAYSHVAHNCVIGNYVIMANAATLAGHVYIQDYAIVGGLSAVHQFVRIGTHAFIGGKTGVPKDIPPYVLASGERARLFGINTVGLKRKNFPDSVIKALKECYRIIFRSRTPLQKAVDEAERKLGDVVEVRLLLDFIRGTQRGITR
jgi:UDP-N-acetylglucosamine acyltransferase